MDRITDLELRTGNAMPCMGLGTWQLTDDTAGAVAEALSAGYRMIDTSGDYGTQPGIGEGIRRSGVARGDVYLVTKIEDTDEDAYAAVRRNLGDLGLDYANLILIHRPPEDGAGEDLWRGLLQARREGLTRDVGVSNYPVHQVEALLDATGEMPAINQLEWSPFGHSEQMAAYAESRDMVIQAYSPLTRGTRLDDQQLSELAAKYGKSPAQILIRWNLQRGTVPIPKANRREHLKENIDVFDFEITAEDIDALSRLNEAYSSLGKLPYE